MSYDIKWIGHENSPGHDKIWGYALMSSGAFYSFWAGRGKALQFKRLEDRWDAIELARKKSVRYHEKNMAQMNALWPEFSEKFENDFALAKLSGKIRTDDCND